MHLAQVTVQELDVRDDQGMLRLAEELRPDAVVWLAALLASQAREAPDEAEDVQVHAFERFLATGRGGATRVVLASSSYVYGHFPASPLSETADLAPVDVYGRTKVAAERHLAHAAEEDGFSAIALRPSAVFGPGDPRARFATVAFEGAIHRGVIDVPEPDFVSDFTYVEDAVQGFTCALHHPDPPRVANLAFGRARTNEEFARAVVGQVGGDVRLLPSTWRESGYVPARGALDVRRARRMGVVPRHDLPEGVAAYLRERRRLLGQSWRPRHVGQRRSGQPA
jgi:nucleoside-diphosphate-sugar epimerase